MSGTEKNIGNRLPQEEKDHTEKTMLWGLDDTLENGFLVRETLLAAGDFCPPHWHDYL